MTPPESNDVTGKVGANDQTSLRTGFQPGEVLDGRYQVIANLGKGGMGVVYRVKQVLLNREFALKTINKQSLSAVAIRRFQHEARTAFAVRHPNIIAVHDFGLLDDETPFLAMEMVNGETLAELLARTGRLPANQALPIFVQVCFGLAYAHQCGVVHRDIKPSNIMLVKGMSPGSEGSVKILDFGIAKFMQHEGGEIQALTKTGEIFGSPLYMSPEQCSGLRVDHRADIYSLGCVLFESLTGTPPFIGDNALSTLMKHQAEQAPTLREASLGTEFPPALEETVAKMLAKSPDGRYTDLGIAAQDLGALARGEATSLTANSERTRSRPEQKTISMTGKSFSALLFGTALISASAAGIAGYFFHDFHRRGTPKRPQTESSQTQPEQEFSPVRREENDQLYSQALFKVISSDELKRQLAQPTPDRKFQLAGYKISGKSLAQIVETPWIRNLDLQDCEFSNDSLIQLAKLRAQRVNLNHTNFNDIGADALSRCRGLSVVRVSATDLTDKGVSKLTTMKDLTELYIKGLKITDKNLRELSNCPNLTLLDITGAKQITNDGLSALEQSRVRILLMAATQTDDTGIDHISKMQSLTAVSLAQTKITISGLEKLCRMKNMAQIYIEQCPNLKEAEIRKLQSEFPGVRMKYLS